MNKNILKEKELIVSEVEKLTKASDSVLIVGYSKMTVDQLSKLRLALRKASSTFGVYKNTLVKRATQNLSIADQGLDLVLNGPSGFIFTKDALETSKLIVKFSKTNENLKIKGAIQDGKFLSADQVKVLASLPGRTQLLSMLASALQGPIRNLAVAVRAVADAKPQANA
jgi:large subunit ribosomal protein L10